VPKLQTLELTGVCDPARVVSGDYYDFIQLDQQSTALVIGDISGKGISAASNGALSTALLVSRLNQQLYENTPPEKYATFYCAIYDDHSGHLTYTNAGHLAPILIRNGNIIRLDSNGMAVGLFPDFSYEQSVIQLQTGDLLMAFTDGVTEAENKQGEQFGEERLIDLLILHRDKPLADIVRIVTNAVTDWGGDDSQDDTTILLARRI
jgi:sigma-B regulation protein RsbU (phosphoserine phosphatase)